MYEVPLYATTSFVPYAVPAFHPPLQVKDPDAPVSPLGIVKLNVADEEDPAFVTDAFDPGNPVETVPTAIVADVPLDP